MEKEKKKKLWLSEGTLQERVRQGAVSKRIVLATRKPLNCKKSPEQMRAEKEGYHIRPLSGDEYDKMAAFIERRVQPQAMLLPPYFFAHLLFHALSYSSSFSGTE